MGLGGERRAKAETSFYFKKKNSLARFVLSGGGGVQKWWSQILVMWRRARSALSVVCDGVLLITGLTNWLTGLAD